jgi:hypothetical protein
VTKKKQFFNFKVILVIERRLCNDQLSDLIKTLFITMNKSYPEILNEYGLSTPDQVKQRIIWNHVKAIIQHVTPPTPENKARLMKYENHFNKCEEAQRENAKE